MAQSKPTPSPAVAPVVPPDEAWGTEVSARKDAALAAEQTLRNNLVAREAHFDRETARLEAAKASEIGSLKTQIDQQLNIQASCDAALGALRGGGNVVALKPVAAE